MTDIADLGTGHTPSRNHPEYWGGEIPWIGIRDAGAHHGGVINTTAQTVTPLGLENSAARLLPKETVCLSRTASVGYVVKMGRDMATSQDFVTWSCSEALDPDFLMAALLAEGAEIRKFGEGSTHTTIYFPAVKAFHIDLPPKAEQRRIVAKLDELTARIVRARAELHRVSLLSPSQKQSLLRTGVLGELTARWRTTRETEPVSVLLQRIETPKQGRGGREATDKIIAGAAGLSVNDPGSPLPPGWEWVPLLRVAKQETGHTPSRSRSDYWEGELPWVGIRDAGQHHGKQIHDTMQTITEAGLVNSSARLLPTGTVCLSRTASVGYVTMMARPMATSQDFATWTCTEALLPEYLMYALMAEGDDIRNFGMGSTHTTIYFPEIRALHIALPPLDEQRQIVQLVKSTLARADHLEAEAARARKLLDRLESALLAKAFRGELVPQDPMDEPASMLLERIGAQRATAPKPRRGRGAAAE
ncbi:restriction endonuclease subunit S [Rhizobium leguminosarum]|uniref:restriction endonuclease subunit S n=1 Tax=Rhizobium leguminosarum TaxID=384 RepID=UPI002E15827A|nr:restriction endonuclease subunit S [Rhizobium leguminosarum]WSH73049.1 restriction endonuclease subunit S [Rhizobium leguminosarum]